MRLCQAPPEHPHILRDQYDEMTPATRDVCGWGTRNKGERGEQAVAQGWQ